MLELGWANRKVARLAWYVGLVCQRRSLDCANRRRFRVSFPPRCKWSCNDTSYLLELLFEIRYGLARQRRLFHEAESPTLWGPSLPGPGGEPRRGDSPHPARHSRTFSGT